MQTERKNIHFFKNLPSQSNAHSAIFSHPRSPSIASKQVDDEWRGNVRNRSFNPCLLQFTCLTSYPKLSLPKQWKVALALQPLWRTVQYKWRLSERPYDIDERRTLTEKNCLKNILLKGEKYFI